MQSYHAAALLTTAVVLTFLAGACTKQAQIAQPPHRLAYTLGLDALPGDLFCVFNEPSPLLQPHEIGLHCTNVLAVRKWIASQRFAD